MQTPVIVVTVVSLVGGLLPIIIIATLVFLYRNPIKVTMMAMVSMI